MISAESSSAPGRWVTARAEYLRGIMDSVSEVTVETVVFVASSQVGKTETLLNVIGFLIDTDPSLMLYIMPTLEMADGWSHDRLTPMIRDTASLADKVAPERARDTKNTVRHKSFPGGRLAIGGANSPSGLASRPIRVVLADEVDRYPPSAAKEGDPVSLARKRTATFWNRKVILASTPTIKGFSRIEAEYELSDKRRYFVPCPHCEHPQILLWKNVQWPPDKPEDAAYVCEECGAFWTEAQRNQSIRKGFWQPTALGNGRTAGFHISELYSPWSTLPQIAQAFLDAKGQPEKLKTWVNTSLGESWEEDAERLDSASLSERAQSWGERAPAGVVVMTCGVDTQPDRLEVERVGWGHREESWSLEHRIFYGDPNKPEVWQELDAYLLERTETEDGRTLRVQATCVDTGGHNTQAAYAYCKPRLPRRIYAIKGGNQPGQPVWPKRASKKNKLQVHLFTVGVHAAKDVVVARLKQKNIGPGYCHFPKDRDEEYFKQLTAERVITKYVKGFPVRTYVKDSGVRNEAFDCRVYAYAAVVSLNVKWDAIAARQAKEAEAGPSPQAAPAAPAAPVTREPDPPPAAPPMGQIVRRARTVVRSTFIRR